MVTDPRTDRIEIWISRPAAGWRFRIARWLRRAATVLDGQRDLRFGISSCPALPTETVDNCVSFGVDAIARALCSEHKQAVEEEQLRRLRPDLFLDEERPGAIR